MDERRRRDEERGVSVGLRLGQGLQVRQQHAGGRVEPQGGDLQVHEHLVGGVLAEETVVDAGGVVDDDFGRADFGHGGFEGGGQGDVVGHVGGVGPYRGGGGGGRYGGSVPGEVGGGAGEEGDVGEAMVGEEAGDVRAYHGAGADDEEGAWGCHCEWKLKGEDWVSLMKVEEG